MPTPTLDAHADPLKLRDRRLQAGLSQQGLAQAAGCSIAMVRLLEGGFTPSRSAVLSRIVRVLNESSPAGKQGSPTSTDMRGLSELYPTT